MNGPACAGETGQRARTRMGENERVRCQAMTPIRRSRSAVLRRFLGEAHPGVGANVFGSRAPASALVLRQRRVDGLRPSVNAAFHVVHVAKTLREQLFS